MKRQSFTLKLAALLVVFGVLNLQAVNTIIHTATFDFNNLTLETDTLGGVTYTTVHYDGLYNDGEPGMPSLPVDYIRFSVPWNATNFRISTSTSNNVTTNLGSPPIYPCQPLRFMCDTTPVVITLPDSATYNSSAYYPSRRSWIADEGFLAGENHIVTVAVMPITYLHRTTGSTTINRIMKTGTIRLTLSYDLSDSLAMYPIVRNDSALRAEGYRLTQSMVVNPTNVQAYAPTDMMLDSLEFIIPNSGDGLNGGPVTPPDSTSISNDFIFPSEPAQIWPPYLIITTPNLLHSMRRLAALKSQKGYDVQVVTITDVLNSPYAGQGDMVNNVLTYTDDAGKLRQYLRHYYQSIGGDYVLLAGNGIPYRSFEFLMAGHPFMMESDAYFSDFNSNWSIGSDWTSGQFEIKPEMYVGRIIAKEASQISNYTDKLFRYELNPGNGSTEYLRHAFYSQSYDMRHLNEVNKVLPTLKSIFPIDSLMQESDNFNDTSKFPSGQDIINEINATQYGFLSFHHHGDPAGLLIYGYRAEEIKDSLRFLWALDTIYKKATNHYNDDPLTGNGLNNMKNKYYPNICYSTACKTMPFGTIPGYEELTVNFGESFTTGKDYGGPIFIGNTYKGHSPISGELEAAVGNELLKNHFEIGKANALAKMLFFNTYFRTSQYVCAVQNLLGDPSLEIWTDIPQKFSNISVTRSDNSISISGISADPTIVAIYNNGGIIRKRIAHTDSVSYSADPNSTVMLYKHNYIPYIAPLVLQKVNLDHSQYVIASDVIAGKYVDNNRTNGDVIVKNGVEYEIEASGTVMLYDGFKVEKGATFAVYPSCF